MLLPIIQLNLVSVLRTSINLLSKSKSTNYVTWIAKLPKLFLSVKVPKTNHRGSACSTTLATQFNIHNMKDQNKENNINKKISQYFIPSNKNSNKIIPIHTINIEKLNSIYLISMQDTKKQ